MTGESLEFSRILDFFTSTPVSLRIIFEIFSLEYVSHDVMINADFHKSLCFMSHVLIEPNSLYP